MKAVSVTPICPKCRRVIPESDVNVTNDVAFCRACNSAHKLSHLLASAELEQDIDVSRPPPGAWRQSTGLGATIGATHRALGSAIGALAISLFWNGIVSVFVLCAISGTLYNLHIPVPEWFPAPKMNGTNMSVGMVIFLWIFLTPFIVIGLAMIGAFLSCTGGRTEVRMHHSEGTVFTGIGMLGIRRRFNTQAVKEVRIDDKQWRDSDGGRQSKTHIVIETLEGKLIKFGGMLREDRRKYVAAAVRKAIAEQV
jgi:hypothetical protein